MKTKVLVTGADGQLGKSIFESSLDYTKSIEFKFVNRTQLDITNPEDLRAFFNTNDFDYCINCAAYTNVDLAETETKQAINVNALAVKNLALLCLESNTTLIHISTDYVFDGTKKSPYTEDDHPNPINSYGQSKLQGEEYIREYLTGFYIIRTSWLYSKFNKNFVKTIVKKLKEDQKLKIVTSQKGAPTSCNELSNFILFLITNRIKAFGTYHFSAEGETTWYGLALHISKHFKKSAYISAVDDYKTKAKRPSNSVLDSSKVSRLLKKPLAKWEDSVDRIVLDLTKSSSSED